MTSPVELNSAELDALFQPPHADAKTIMKPIVPMDEDGNPGIGITIDDDTQKTGLLVTVRDQLAEVSKPDGSDFSVFIMRRGKDQRKKKVHITDPPHSALAVQRESDGAVHPIEIPGLEIVDEEGFADFWEKVVFCARQGVNIEKIVPL